MSATQQETTINVQDAAGQSSVAAAGGKSEHQTVQDGPPPPAYQPSVATNPYNPQQPSITPAVDITATQQGSAAIKEPQRLVTPLQALTEQPAWIDCPFCKQRAQTRSTRQGDSQQALASFLCCLVCICLVCLPCIAGWCENIHIYCSQCGREVAMIPHDGMIQVAPVPPEGGHNGLRPSRYAS
ncbi:hypothetical protein F5B22DRAFT_592392 [Xylaria bambusicola]|uniref:uncharacterized protein n=1 Tax=Xylaria bambusicola TaxID=326684 RepID=UPI002008807B|nr:uncharacterized protein F5B22DRAFT_592392 [Xylaria bambusicola]KAI0523882.1 hypothetical protein F5B22DRAFT_592392 [Xylaria bambusicola]